MTANKKPEGLFIPKKIKLGPFKIRIETWSRSQAAAIGKFGEWSPCEQTIRVDLAQVPAVLITTLMHELNHAIYWAYRLEDGDRQERVVDVMATAWAQLFLDNPSLIELLTHIGDES